MKVIYIIVNEGYSAEAVNILYNAGAKGSTILNARGGAVELNRFNVPIEPAKEVIISLVEEDVCEAAILMLKDRLNFDSSANGVFYTLNVDSVNFINKLEN